MAHSAAPRAPAHAARSQHQHTTHSPPSASSQVNGYVPLADAMRVQPRYHASRGGQCASGALLGGLGGLLLTEKGQVAWGWSIALTQCTWRA